MVGLLDVVEQLSYRLEQFEDSFRYTQAATHKAPLRKKRDKPSRPTAIGKKGITTVYTTNANQAEEDEEHRLC